jgi:hypothetical protein
MADRCQICGAALGVRHRADQVYCGRRCRNIAWRRRRNAAAAQRPAPVAPAPAPPPEPPSELDAVLERALDEQRLLTYVARLAATPGSVGLRAATWLLERRYPQRWAPPMRSVPVSAPDDDAAVEATVQRWLKLVPPTNG